MSQENLLFILQAGGKILNSRIGLVVLFLLYSSSPWGLGSQIHNIELSIATQTEILRSSQKMELDNTRRIAQLVERCRIIEK